MLILAPSSYHKAFLINRCQLMAACFMVESSIGAGQPGSPCPRAIHGGNACYNFTPPTYQPPDPQHYKPKYSPTVLGHSESTRTTQKASRHVNALKHQHAEPKHRKSSPYVCARQAMLCGHMVSMHCCSENPCSCTTSFATAVAHWCLQTAPNPGAGLMPVHHTTVIRTNVPLGVIGHPCILTKPQPAPACTRCRTLRRSDCRSAPSTPPPVTSHHHVLDVTLQLLLLLQA